MNELEKMLNKGHQRAGLLAIITGTLQTTSCNSTKKSMASTLKHVFDQYPVGDDVEKMTRRGMDEVLDDKEDSAEDQLKSLIAMMREALKD